VADTFAAATGGHAGEPVQDRFAKARRSGYATWLWPDVSVVHWRLAIEEIVRVARSVLAGESNTILVCSNANAMGVAGYTSGMGPLLGYWIEIGVLTAEITITEIFRLHLLHNRRRMGRLSRVVQESVDKLGEVNVTPLILKGMHTAVGYFPEPGARPLSDIDMYIPTESMGRAEGRFAELGYQRVPRMQHPYACDWVEPSQPRLPRTLTFVHEDDPWSIDVLGSLDKTLPTGARIAFDGLLPCTGLAELFSGREVRIMRQPLLALYLSSHISQTLLNVTVLRVLELVLVIRRDSARRELDWGEFLRGASLMGGPRFVYPALAFAEELAAGIVPAEIMAAAASDAARNLRRVVERLTVASAQPLKRHSLGERFMWARTGREYLTQIAGEFFIDGHGRPLDRALYGIGTKLWALGRGRYST
jgi:hypothetical protein